MLGMNGPLRNTRRNTNIPKKQSLLKRKVRKLKMKLKKPFLRNNWI